MLAMLAVATALGDMGVACVLLAQYCATLHLPTPSNMASYIRTWQGRLNPDGTVASNARNAGRPSSISPQMVEAAYQGIIGWKKSGMDRLYRTRDGCAEECPAVVKVLQESGITIAALFKLIKKAHPRFKFTKMKVHWHLSDADKEKRVTTCQLLLQNFSHLLHRMVFIDAKTIYMWEKDIYGWVDTSVDNYADGIKPARYKRQIIRLKYYAAVHMKLGPVFLKYYTGTTGMDNNPDGHNYQVGSGYEQLRRAPTPHMTHSLCQLGSPSRALRLARLDALVNTQPQQTFALHHCCLSIQLILQLPDSHAVVSVVGLGEQPANMPLPMHFNEQAAGRCKHNIPYFLLRAHSHTHICHRPVMLVQHKGLSCILQNQRFSITQCIQNPFPCAALLGAHPAVECCAAVVGRSHTPKHNMLSAWLAGPFVEQLMLAVTCVVCMCACIHLLMASTDGCAVMLPAPPARFRAALLPPPCTCRQAKAHR